MQRIKNDFSTQRGSYHYKKRSPNTKKLKKVGGVGLGLMQMLGTLSAKQTDSTIHRAVTTWGFLQWLNSISKTSLPFVVVCRQGYYFY